MDQFDEILVISDVFHSGQIMPWSDCLKTKGNVNIKLRDLCETLIVYILLSTF